MSLLAKRAVGVRALRSYAGKLAFFAGLLSTLRPFMPSLWAAMGSADLEEEAEISETCEIACPQLLEKTPNSCAHASQRPTQPP